LEAAASGYPGAVDELGRRVVVITGASAGVGRAAARAFAGTGTSVALLARGQDGLEAAVKEVEAEGAIALALPVDVADADAVERAASIVEGELGPIDVWVNDAMVSVFASLPDITAAEFRRVTEVAYLGTVHGTMAALRRMRPRDRGVILQVGSALAYRGIPLQSAYCGAKHAIQGFTESVRCELLHERSRVRITMVQLPALNTPQFDWSRTKMPRQPQPVPPIYQPEVAARALVWAADHPRREVLVGATTVATVWANKLVPGLLDRYLGRTGFESQQSKEPTPQDRRDNLFQAVAGDVGAHGRFDRRSHPRSAQLWLTTHRRVLAAGAAAAVLGATLMARRA
jgi:NAD(P)-dependent dehydrogenase (short-subunit alcohol dehydrogenase family)